MILDDVRQILKRLAPHGWEEFFSRHGLNILADDIENALGRELDSIDRTFPGLEDLSTDCTRAVEPGSPARSLLYHALASPNVTSIEGETSFTEFPTPHELDIVENYVYAVKKQNMTSLQHEAKQISERFNVEVSETLAVVMFASEYRPADETVHKLHTDMAYSRTGVARVGTAAPRYMPSARGFWPASDEPVIHCVPCVWKAFICARVTATPELLNNPAAFGPMSPLQSDIGQAFWVPLHKLFDGMDCLEGEDIKLIRQIHHENSKISRIHKFLDRMGKASHVGQADLAEPPYLITKGIAEFSSDPDLAVGTVVPNADPSLVAVARDSTNKPVTFVVPDEENNDTGSIKLFWSSLELRTPGDNRPVPEYVHIRHVVADDGSILSLNDDRDMMDKLRRADFQAVHYVDFTGAGYVSLESTGLSAELEIKPGYSIVAAPDFYPSVDQKRVEEWTELIEQMEPNISRNIGWGAPPKPLSTIRVMADPNIRNDAFQPFPINNLDSTASTISAVITTFDAERSPTNSTKRTSTNRCSTLPDAAAGIFAPGWDVSIDQTDDIQHLSGYGLGSPFPEDSKLCAALSAFWPAAAPDTTRTYEPRGRSTAPMIDDEIISAQSWDGIAGVEFDATRGSINFPDRDFADYVESALANKFDIRRTADVDFDEYIRRVYRTAQVREYINRNPRLDVPRFALASFTLIDDADPVLISIQNDTGVKIGGFTYLFIIVSLPETGRGRRLHNDHRRRRVSASRVIRFIADDANVVHRELDTWEQLNAFVGV